VEAGGASFWHWRWGSALTWVLACHHQGCGVPFHHHLSEVFPENEVKRLISMINKEESKINKNLQGPKQQYTICIVVSVILHVFNIIWRVFSLKKAVLSCISIIE
jgi:hypothetical protein